MTTRCLAAAAQVAALLACSVPVPVHGQCEVGVQDTFRPPGVNGTVYALLNHDDGAGPAMYVGGLFTVAGDLETSCIARWDGREWAPLGEGLNQRVSALAVYDDGRGPAVYAAGRFTEAGGRSVNQLARWDGSQWEPVGHGTNGVDGEVHSLCVFDEDGPGPGRPALFVGGSFLHAGGIEASSIARWDGVSWTAVGGGVRPEKDSPAHIYAMTVHDEDGAGPLPPSLYAGGYFSFAGEEAITSLARWDGAAWSQVGDGMLAIVQALASFDRGDDPRLIVGGFMGTAGGKHVDGIAQWDGEAWSELANGLYAWVTCLGVHDADGDGPLLPTLYLGGYITVASGVYVNNFGTWNGRGFGEVSGGVNGSPYAIATFDTGAGPTLVVGGGFDTVGAHTVASNIALWRMSQWSSIEPGVNHANAAVVFDAGDGPALYAAANVSQPNGWSSVGIVRWDGVAWHDVGLPTSGIFTGPSGLEVVPYPDGVPTLYACGQFRFADGSRSSLIASWNGHRWIPLPGARGHGFTDLAVYDDGDGAQLYTSGGFDRIGGAEIRNIARFNGSAWFPVGDGLDDASLDMEVYNDGSGPALYVGGEFTSASGVPARHVARWDGISWSPLGAGCPSTVTDLQVHRLPSGETRLLAAQDRDAVMQWDGAAWTLFSPREVMPRTLLVHDPDGAGPAPESLYGFGTESGISGAWKWSGIEWTPIVTPRTPVSSGALFDPDGAGPRPEALYLAGYFQSLNGVPTSSLGSVTISGEAPILAPLPERIVVALPGEVTVTVEHPPEPRVTYLWRRDGVELHERSRSIRLRFPGSASGTYDVVVSTPCGAAVSTPMRVQIGCRADINRDGVVNSVDFFAFVDAFMRDAADFNYDGRTDSRDFFEYLDAYFNEC